MTFSKASEKEFRIIYWDRSVSVKSSPSSIDSFPGHFTYHATELVHGSHCVDLFRAVRVFLLNETSTD